MKKLMIFLFIMIFHFFKISDVKAILLEQKFIDDVYYTRIAKDGTSFTDKQAYFYLDGKFAYCLEPDVGAKEIDYDVLDGLESFGISLEKQQRIEEFGYYGYEYLGHQTLNYYLAAQELIWEYLSDYEIKWTTARNNGEEINVEKEKNEILLLIEESKRLPSFAKEEITLYEGESLNLEDENSVLNQFEILDSFFQISNNSLISKPIYDKKIVTGILKPYDYQTTKLYKRDGFQSLATLRISKPVYFEMKINIEGVSIVVHKLGEKWNGIWNTNEWEKQDDVVFKLYAEEDIVGHFGNIMYKKDSLLDTLVTREGVSRSKSLPKGKYRLEEVKGKDGYLLSGSIIIELNNYMEKEFNIEVKNKLSTGKIKLIKKGADGSLLSKVVFGLYNKNGEKLDEKSTDEKGEIIWDNLPDGDYIIKELFTVNGYELDENLSFVSVEGEEVEIEKVNMLLLPDTSSVQSHYLQIVIGAIGLVFYHRWSRRYFY